MSSPSQLEPRVTPRETSYSGLRVLLIAWEYPGAQSRRGTALARRVGQVARGLSARGWKVTVVHRIQRAGDPAGTAFVEELVPNAPPVRRRAVSGPPADSRLPRWLMPIRKLSTAWAAFTSGDRSGRWAANALRVIEASVIERPDIVVAFFTPRGPLAVAAALHRQQGTPWLADLQDPWWEGASPWLRPLVARWMRRTLRSAHAVVQVSPEWAARDAQVLRREVTVVRHAVPTMPPSEEGCQAARDDNVFRILHAGSLSEDVHDIRPFMDAVQIVVRDRASGKELQVDVAGGEAAWTLFVRAATARGIARFFRWLGWLDADALRRAMCHANCLLLIPLFPAHRLGVPSKLFEYVAYDTPVLVAGPDSGGMTSLLEEWAHPPVLAATAQEIASAICRARDGDPSGLLQRRRCGRAPVTEETLAGWYSERMRGVLHEVHSR